MALFTYNLTIWKFQDIKYSDNIDLDYYLLKLLNCYEAILKEVLSGRRVIYAASLSAIGIKQNGKTNNEIILEYYKNKLKSKKA